LRYLYYIVLLHWPFVQYLISVDAIIRP